MQWTVFDIETDGLLESLTKIHCLSYSKITNGEVVDKGSFTDYEEMKTFLLNQEILVGHNIVRFDVPAIEKVLGITVNCRKVDTLALSWYLWPTRSRHGLEVWGYELGVKKPEIEDWNNLNIRDYIFRCESDVDINTLLLSKIMTYLMMVYGDLDRILNLIDYLVFKLECAREQEEVKCKIDRNLVNSSLQELNVMREDKIEALIAAMPKNIKYREVLKPKKLLKKDGTYSSIGIKWLNLLVDQGLPEDTEGPVLQITSIEDGNPSSTTQLKNWLSALGWEPKNFEYRKNTKGEINQVSQIYVGDQVCPSIKLLYEVEPALENLDMLSLINHRISIFESFLSKMDDESFVKAEVNGFTNTLRFKHVKPIVNLPSKFKFYGDKIRGSIIAPNEESLLCGSDMSSLEDSTKQHYMYFFDPEYVTQMRTPGFDPHLDIAVLAGMLTDEQSEEHKIYSKTKGSQGIDHSQVRGKSKTVNFAAVYGAGPPKIAQSTGMPLEQAQKLHKTYWERNKAVKQVANSCQTQTTYMDGVEQMWLLNPVSNFWYTLRFEKDKFSTLNQGTGVYCFDLWVREVRARGIKIMLQYHDEIAFPLATSEKDSIELMLKEAISSVNSKVRLNVPLGISIDFNTNYAAIH